MDGSFWLFSSNVALTALRRRQRKARTSFTHRKACAKVTRRQRMLRIDLQTQLKGKKMKKVMILMSAMLVAAAAHAQSVKTVPFEETVVNVPAKVHFVRGNEFAFEVKASDKRVARSLQCKVQSGVLTFGYGKAAKDGTVNYVAETNTYYYGNDAALATDAIDANSNLDYEITIISPAMPELRTSSSYMLANVVKADLNGDVAISE
jgi:hypothetical protein